MPYAEGRRYLDADSHIMERPNFLLDHADAATREILGPLLVGDHGKSVDYIEDAAKLEAHRASDVAAMRALGPNLIAGPKGYRALGAFNATERSDALDQLGFARQLVFATFSTLQTLQGDNVALKYGAAAAHNRAMAEFCGGDDRLMGVANLPLDNPELAITETEHLIGLGLRAAWVAHQPCGGRSPGHDAFDPVWARLAEAGVPVVLHVGGVPIQLDEAWMNTGRPIPKDWQGGGENVRGKDMIALHQGAELFLGAMIFDGVFERHRKLRAAAIELGAGWVPGWLRRLDWSAKIWKKEPDLAALTRTPSEIALEQLAFTPYVYEDVGQLIGESDAGLYLFSSDYPHFEGSKNPIERFENFLAGAEVSAAARADFYQKNFERMFGLAD